MTTNTPRAAGLRSLQERRPMIVILSELHTAAAHDGATRSR